MANRGCNTCGLCCKIMAIKELRKPAGEWCKYWSKGKGCRIHNKPGYPIECKDFECMYIATKKEIPELFPQKTLAVIAQCNVVPDQRGLGIYKDKRFEWGNNNFLNLAVRTSKQPIWSIQWWDKRGVACNSLASDLISVFTIEDDFDE